MRELALDLGSAARLVTWRRASVGLVGTLLIGASVVVACREDGGCGDEQDPPVGVFDDTPRPRLCPSDTLTLTPSAAQLAARPQSGVDAGVVGNSTDAGGSGAEAPDAGGGAVVSQESTIQLGILGRRDTGQPHETAHIDVTLCASSSGHALTLSPTSDSSLPGGCKRVSDVFLECTLDANGAASFRATAVPGAAGTERICAKSGSREAFASVQVGVMTTIDGVQFLVDDRALLVDAPTPMACTSPAPENVTCANVTSRPLTLASTRELATPGDGGALFVDGGLVAPSGPVDVTLAVVPKAGADAWLSTTSACRERRRSLPVRFDGKSPLSDTVFLCSDGAQGAASVLATFPARGLRASTSSTDVPALGVPAILATAVAADAGAAGPAYRFVARDCRGNPLPGMQLTLSTGGGGTTGPDGALEIATTPPDGGAVTAQAVNPHVIGAPSSCGVALAGGAP